MCDEGDGGPPKALPVGMRHTSRFRTKRKVKETRGERGTASSFVACTLISARGDGAIILLEREVCVTDGAISLSFLRPQVSLTAASAGARVGGAAGAATAAISCRSLLLFRDCPAVVSYVAGMSSPKP